MDTILENIQLIPLSALLLLPGVVWLRSEGKFLSCAKVDQVERTFTYLLYSLLTYSACYLLFRTEVDSALQARLLSTALVLKIGTVSLATAFVGGIATGLFRRSDIAGSLFARLGIHTVHPADSGWNQAFARRNGCLVRLTFRDGNDRYAVFGRSSLVAASGVDEDAYFEKTFCEDSDGNLVPEHGTEGIWVSKSELSCARFYSVEGLNTDEARQACAKRDSLQWVGGFPTSDESEPAGAIGGQGDLASTAIGSQGSPTDAKSADTDAAHRQPQQPVKVGTGRHRGDFEGKQAPLRLEIQA